MLSRVLTLLDESQKLLKKNPYTEEEDRMVVLLQSEAQKELDTLAPTTQIPTPIEDSKVEVPATP